MDVALPVGDIVEYASALANGLYDHVQRNYVMRDPNFFDQVVTINTGSHDAFNFNMSEATMTELEHAGMQAVAEKFGGGS